MSAEARLALHWAAQLPSAAGATLAEPKSDFSHTALTWRSDLDAMVGAELPHGLHAGFRPRDFVLLVITADGAVRAELALDGVTLEAALSWLGKALGTEGRALERPPHELPDHPVAQGRPFVAPDAGDRALFADGFATAARGLEEVARTHPEANPVRLWPHHFDIATMIPIDIGEDPEKARSIGVGFSPGDGGIGEPYFYVTPWPYPAIDADELPALESGGRWNTQGWTGAVLRVADIETLDEPTASEAMGVFLESTIAACRSLLGG